MDNYNKAFLILVAILMFAFGLLVSYVQVSYTKDKIIKEWIAKTAEAEIEKAELKQYKDYLFCYRGSKVYILNQCKLEHVESINDHIRLRAEGYEDL